MTAREMPRNKLMRKLNQVFIDHGYDQLTMGGMSKAADVSRRSLYNYVSNKEDAFREMIRWTHGVDIRAGLEAGRRVLAEGGDAVDVLVTIFDIRYGVQRRALGGSPHAQEINYQAFRRCYDIMVASAVTFQDEVAKVLTELAARGLLEINPAFSADDLAQLLSDGARGVNQTLPARPETTLPERYRRMVEAVLFGCAVRPTAPAA